jgi:hypothetical protein
MHLDAESQMFPQGNRTHPKNAVDAMPDGGELRGAGDEVPVTDGNFTIIYVLVIITLSSRPVSGFRWQTNRVH